MVVGWLVGCINRQMDFNYLLLKHKCVVLYKNKKNFPGKHKAPMRT